MQWATFQKLTMLKFTVFTLPWLVVAMLLALWDPATAARVHLSPTIAVLMLLALIGARVAGMAFNRLIDQEQDSYNPRTLSRALPAGEVTRGQVIWIALGGLLLLFVSAATISWQCLALALPLGALLFLYSFAKYRTPYCHFIMSMNQALLPLCVLIALTGTISTSAVWVSIAIWLLIGANDVIYCIQDIGYDRKAGIHNLPAVLGAQKALYVAWILHGVMVGALFMAAWFAHAPLGIFLAVFAAAAFVAYENSRVDVKDNNTIMATSFATNTFVPVILLAFATGEWVWQTL